MYRNGTERPYLCTARIRETKSGIELVAVMGHSSPLRSASLSPNDDEILTGSHCFLVSICSSSVGNNRLLLDCQSRVSVVEYPPGEISYHQLREWISWCLGKDLYAVKTSISPLMGIDLRPQGRMGRSGCVAWRIYLHEPDPIPIPHINPQLIFSHRGLRYYTLNCHNSHQVARKRWLIFPTSTH